MTFDSLAVTTRGCGVLLDVLCSHGFQLIRLERRLAGEA